MMTGILNVKRCGGCHFAKIIPNDLSKRICHGAPPSAIQVQARNGQLALQMTRPLVGITDEACALYRGKDEQDVERDTMTMRELQQHGPPPVETKQ